MAKAWRETETYNIPIVAANGVSHYLPTKIQWLKVRRDDGSLSVQLGKIRITEPNYGEA